jgi:hypothetical protein
MKLQNSEQYFYWFLNLDRPNSTGFHQILKNSTGFLTLAEHITEIHAQVGKGNIDG